LADLRISDAPLPVEVGLGEARGEGVVGIGETLDDGFVNVAETLLQITAAFRETRVPLAVRIRETCIPLAVRLLEQPVHLVEQHLRIRIHRAASASEARVVGVWRRRRRWWSALGSVLQRRLRIGPVACWELQRSKIEQLDPISNPGLLQPINETHRINRRRAERIDCL
jgi:hypothetical protein